MKSFYKDIFLALITFFIVSFSILISFLLGAPSVSAIIYLPGQTLNPTCLPTSVDCGVDITMFPNTGLNLASGSSNPTITANQLYNVANVLNWNGIAVALSGSGSSITSLNVSVNGSLSTLAGSDYTTIGSANNVALGPTSFIRYAGAGAATFTGISGGTNGKIFYLVNASGSTLTLADNSLSSVAVNRIRTGTGTNFDIRGGAAVTLVYDSVASLWRLAGGAGGNLDSAYDAFGAGPSKIVVDGLQGQTEGLQFETAGANSLIFNIGTGGTGSIQLQNAGTSLFTVSNTGAITLAGPTSVSGANTFTVGTGATSLGGNLLANGNVTIGDAATRL